MVMRTLVFALALIFTNLTAWAQTPGPKFTHTGVAKDAQRYESWLKTTYGQP